MRVRNDDRGRDGNGNGNVSALLSPHLDHLLNRPVHLVVDHLDVVKHERPAEQVLVQVPDHVAGDELAVEEGLAEDAAEEAEVGEVLRVGVAGGGVDLRCREVVSGEMFLLAARWSEETGV